MSKAPAEIRGYPVTNRRFRFVDREFSLLGPANFEALIDEPSVAERFARDEYLPYWAEFWPANLLLTDLVAAWGPAPSPSPLVLELGCGLGLTSLVAAHLGYAVIASDYDDDALAFVLASARENNITPPIVRRIDWRERYAELRVDRIIAAEVLYEARSLRPIAEFIAAHLKPGGSAILVDRSRPTADAFPEIASSCGLQVTQSPVSWPANPESGDTNVAPIAGRMFEIRFAEGHTTSDK
ncbi:MAG: class I SAM-dependent methyltransferase [Phycisphaerae bacterium]